jgi:hypothetical protein
MDHPASEIETTDEIAVTDPEMRQLLGMFDVPAFARRGQDLEFSLEALAARLRRERSAMLDMVRLRLRQWAAAATSPDDGAEHFPASLRPLVAALGGDPPAWSAVPGSRRRRAGAARDLIASVERFNRRWAKLLDELDLRPINAKIDAYNRYYLIEKECVFGSARLASRAFSPRPGVSVESLRECHPMLPSLGPPG